MYRRSSASAAALSSTLRSGATSGAVTQPGNVASGMLSSGWYCRGIARRINSRDPLEEMGEQQELRARQ